MANQANALARKRLLNLKKSRIKGEPQTETLMLDLNQVFPVIPLRDTVVVPGTASRVLVARDSSLRALEVARERDGFAVFVLQRDPELNEIQSLEELYHIGVVVRIQTSSLLPAGYTKVLVEGILLVNVLELSTAQGYLTAKIHPQDFDLGPDDKAARLSESVIDLMRRYAEVQDVPAEFIEALPSLQHPMDVFFAVQPFLKIAPEHKQRLLECSSLAQLFEEISSVVQAVLDADKTIQRSKQEVQHKMQQSQKEWFLNEQIRLLQEELGVSEGGNSEFAVLEQKIRDKKFPQAIASKLAEEMERMKLLHQSSPEYAVVRNYIDWFLALPYNVYTDDNLNPKRVRKELDARHFGLEKVKERILEHVAVLKLTGAEKRSPILCLAGPPGVGKTSLASSIASAMGRQLVRITLGGVRDESEIRGHRRTYIGSMPGRFIQALRRAKCMNPVILLDELDKMSSDFRGDPASALLEVLDPELNHDFTDHFMEVGVDLSRVMFIATANVEENIPEALHDRLEVVRLSGYYAHEKMEIAQRHLVPKVRTRNGLTDQQLDIPPETINTLLREYTREAGVRDLERELDRISRKRAMEVVSSRKFDPEVLPAKLGKYLGVPRYHGNRLVETGRPGLITGLAWTSVGGELLHIECTLLSGRGRIQLTGKLGDVMKESAQIALTLVRERARRYGVDPEMFRKTDIHIHIPEGAIPKDGPSAGIALTLALLSAFTRQQVSPHTAFTGEVSLTGRLHAIGGLNEKALAALEAGVQNLYLPQDNRKNVDELPPQVPKGIKIKLKQHIDDIISELFIIPEHVRVEKKSNGLSPEEPSLFVPHTPAERPSKGRPSKGRTQNN